MRDIDFIPEVVAELAPKWPRIEQRFNEENEAFKKLLAQDHDLIGQVLKCHMIVENYINRHLEAVSPEHDWESAKLRFAQKISLLPSTNPKVAWLLPGIKELNSVRNRLGHRDSAKIELADLPECQSVLAIARSGKKYTAPVELIEDFITVACTWLIVDKEIEGIFEEAFTRAKKKYGI